MNITQAREIGRGVGLAAGEQLAAEAIDDLWARRGPEPPTDTDWKDMRAGLEEKLRRVSEGADALMLGTAEEKTAYLAAVIETAADRCVEKLKEAWADRSKVRP